jgi:hypothetical protein
MIIWKDKSGRERFYMENDQEIIDIVEYCDSVSPRLDSQTKFLVKDNRIDYMEKNNGFIILRDLEFFYRGITPFIIILEQKQ